MASEKSRIPQLPQITPAKTNGNGHAIVASTVENIQATITVTAPIKDWEEGFVRKNLDVVLNRDQARVLKKIQLGLEEKEAQLKNGKYVANAVDAVRWILENIG